MTNNHGGSRKGSGRPRIEGLRPVTVKLTQDTIEAARAYGGGNVSKGIRDKFSADAPKLSTGKD